MPRAFFALLSALATSAAIAQAAFAQAPAQLPKRTLEAPVGAYPGPSAAELADTRREFLDDALRTVGDRAGDLFFLPRKYNFITPVGPERAQTSHFKFDGKIVMLRQGGISHGIPWEYDRHIPLVLWGPRFIKAGQVVQRRTQQQDLAPTYAKLIGCPPPADAKGQVLDEALTASRRPKVILTMVFDQGGEHYYKVHPGATPFVDRLKREGTYFANTRVSHLDMETAMGHVAIGTGAFPMDFGIPSNDFWHGGHGAGYYAFSGPDAPAPTFEMSPSLGDAWLHRTNNHANVFSYCYADRAAMGMGGHGAFYQGNKKPWIYFLDTNTGRLTTNPRYYELPAFLRDSTPLPYAQRLTGGTGVWMDHPIKKPADVLATPALTQWEGDQLCEAIQKLPLGQSDVTDLMYVTLKATDASGHMYGEESEECGAILAEQDRQFQRIAEALIKKVGRDNVVIALTADHGGPPLPELSGGKRLYEKKFIADLNAHFDTQPDGFPVVEFVSGAQLWVDQAKLARCGFTMAQLKQFVLHYQVDGKPFFDSAYTKDELLAIRLIRKGAITPQQLQKPHPVH